MWVAQRGGDRPGHTQIRCDGVDGSRRQDAHNIAEESNIDIAEESNIDGALPRVARAMIWR